MSFAVGFILLILLRFKTFNQKNIIMNYKTSISNKQPPNFHNGEVSIFFMKYTVMTD